MAGLVNFGLGLGLASIAGFRAYFPLVMIGLVTRYSKDFALRSSFEFLNSLPVLILLTLLMTLEFLADKIPAAASFNQFIQTPARVVSGAVLFGATVSELNLMFALVTGALIAAGMVVIRIIFRGTIIETTGEDNEYFLSSVEDVLVITGTIVIVLAPLVSLAGLIVGIIIGYRNFRDRSGTRVSWRG